MTYRVALGAEVEEALGLGVGVVALETSVIGQGLPGPQNAECVQRMSLAVRSQGAVPAWVGVLYGEVRVGLTDEELAAFLEPGRATKVAARDLTVAVTAGVLGATTVSAAIWAANRAGIKVCATGGIGGVHPGKRADVSADLLELARTPVLLVCSGMKSIVDPVATAEKLEELGVLLVGYGVSELPFFLVRESSVKLEHRVENPTQTAALVRSLTGLGRESAVLLCNPVPKAHAMDPDEVSIAVEACRGRAIAQRISGKALTPFLLACLAEQTQGRSLEANLALLDENARVAAAVAVAAAGG